VPRVFRRAEDGMRGYLKVDEARPSEVYSAELLSSAARTPRR
jgi:hypothetical protein